MTDEFCLRVASLRGHDFEEFYSGTPPWDIGRPQPAFVALRDAGALRGPLLDVGCGTGEHALMAAAQGLDATGIDAAPTAIERARKKARQRGLDVTFIVGDALELSSRLDETYNTVIDSALFHVFNDDNRARFVEQLHAVMRPGGRYLMLCFSDQVPGSVGPRRVTEAEIRTSFADGWLVESVQPAELDTTDMAVPAYLAAATRIWFSLRTGRCRLEAG